ncbi:MAG: alpha/beta fold hydrolase [Dolichospermum sp. JUN01]|nr:alpha/beta fold hydrolase [Dolichospermum sp. JUN01]
MSDYQDPVFAVNPANSSQLPVPFIDTVVQAITATKYILSGLSSNSQKDYIMGTAFGQDYNQDSANQILTAWAQNNFTGTPHIEIVFGQNFNGAYAKDNNTIYLSGEFVGANKDHVGAVTGVLVEEVGHSLDSQINVKDAAGDEGDIFSRLVRGQSISSGELLSLKSEDDHGVFVVDGLSVGIEKNVTDVVLGNKVDFNGDGKTDFLRQEKSDWDDDANNTANIFFSNGNATFWKYTLPESFDLKGDKTNLIFGDFNGDRRSDFIRQERSDWDNDSYNTANIFFSNGNGTFWKSDLGDYFKGDLTNLIVGDFNGDGRSDFLRQEKGEWASDSYNTANVFFSNGNGTFWESQLGDYFKGDLTNLIIGDFNGDGRSDILRQEKGAWDNDSSNTSDIFFSNGNGTFWQQNLPDNYDLKGDLTSLFIADFNGDGRSDFFRQEKGGWDDDSNNTANIFFSNGNGTFWKQTLPEWYDLKGDLTNLIIADFNGDGKSDFIRQERGGWDTDNGNTANVFLSYGNGTFSRQDLTDWGVMKGDKVNILVGDFNGDGRSDFIRQEKDSWDDDNVGTAHILTSNGNGTFWSRELTDWWDMKGDLANIFTGARRQFINEITGDIANRGLYKDSWGNVKEDQARYYDDGVNFYRFDGDGRTYQGIESGKETIVFIHGWKNNSDESNFTALMKELTRQNPYKQILALDWRAPAQHDKDWGPQPNYTARAIAPVAQWASSTLKSLGIEAAQLSLVGFSLGAHIAAEIGYIYGKVASLTALDPAYPASDYDIDGNQVGYQGAKNFNEVANKSIALVVSDEDGGWAGDNRRAATANYSFLVRYTNYSGEKDSFYHGSVVTVFRKLLERQFLPSSFAMNKFGDSADSGSSHEGYFTAQWSSGDWQPNWFTKENGSNRISSWV